MRIGPPFAPVPFSTELEAAYFPSAAKIASSVLERFAVG
jgi:hypothetical protein